MMEEESGNLDHLELWFRFAESTGLCRNEVSNAELWPETEILIRAFRSICRDGGVTQGIAALYAYKSHIPEIVKSKIDGLESFYGLNTPDALDYFRIHIEAGQEHSRVKRYSSIPH